jgi:hypothetical protein
MCVDYTSLNKSCPNDPFPLPHNDQVIDLTVIYELLSFQDAYSGYHQIPLTKVDQPTTTFITPFGYFCYIKMLFGLKNVGATYQRCMKVCFKEQIGRNLEVYVDYIMIKSRKGCNLITDLEETFNNLRWFNIKLKLEKCTFGVPRGKLLVYINIKRNIKANPNKISTITEMGLVKNVKDVHCLMGCLASLSRLMSRLG